MTKDNDSKGAIKEEDARNSDKKIWTSPCWLVDPIYDSNIITGCC